MTLGAARRVATRLYYLARHKLAVEQKTGINRHSRNFVVGQSAIDRSEENRVRFRIDGVVE